MNLTTLPTNIAKAIAEILPCLRGWEGKSERPYRMASLIWQEKPQVVVEIGVFGGQSFIPQAITMAALKCGRIYGIDPYDLAVIADQMASLDDINVWLKQDMDMVLRDTRRWIKDLGLNNNATLILSESRWVAGMFASIDILHVDGSHTEAGALNDVLLYGKRVRRGGYIWMDDTDFPSLTLALKELETFCVMIDDWGGYRLYRRA